jgi:hypothetical protein
VRNSTDIYVPNAGGTMSAHAPNLSSGSFTYNQLSSLTSMSYLDSPATTSLTTYKTQFRIFDATSSGRCILQVSSTPSVITLLEIGA